METQEIKIIGEATENRRVRDEYLVCPFILISGVSTAATYAFFFSSVSLIHCPISCRLAASIWPGGILVNAGGCRKSWCRTITALAVKRYRCGDAGRIPPRASSVLHGSWLIAPTRQAPLTCPMNCCVQSRSK